jgi:GNAT superfamily N-acetyltransferase
MGDYKVRLYINFLRLNLIMYYRQSYIDNIAMIRKFTTADAVVCSNLIQACVASDRSISPSLRDAMIHSESPDAMIERSRLFYVAVYESESRISGIAGLDMNEIRILCVSPEHQRRGIGRLLLNHVMEMVPGTLFQDVFVYAAKGAVAFYKAAGFEEKGPMAFAFAGDTLQTVFMTRTIR